MINNNKKQKIMDFCRVFSTICSSVLVIFTLFSIIFYVFFKGSSSLSFDLISSGYESQLNVVSTSQKTEKFSDPNISDTYFSFSYGISLEDGKSLDGESVVKVVYVASTSPFKNLTTSNTKSYQISVGETLDVLMGIDQNGNDVFASAKDGAKKFALALDKSKEVTYLQCIKTGGGIRGSLISTLYLIGLTLLFSLPLGIGASIYLVLYAKDGKIKTIIQSLIDATSGVPSIIFGFVGMIVFIPFVSVFTGVNNYSILAGSLTMTIILLPIIVKTTSESLSTVPSNYMNGSLALGASKTQTIFKVILPNALPGILSSTLLSIGRIIGESAALIFVMGTSIEDSINIFSGATSLSLHIWSITKSENPNYEIASAISIIILLLVFAMSVSVKIVNYRVMKKRGIK